MLKYRNLIFVACLATALLSPLGKAVAMPAYPKPITVAQPDGRMVTVCLRGDERLNWAQTTDGYTLLRNEDGYWTFARQDRHGNLVASSLVYDNTSVQARKHGIKPNLQFSKAQMAKAAARQKSRNDMMVDGTFPSTGKRKLLLLLVNYSDTKPTFSRQDFDRMMNEKGYGGIGSFRDYYLEQSYGKLDIDVTVTDWITLPKPKGTYGPDGAPYMIYDALSLVTDTLNLKDYDNDGDGILDGLAVIHQGTGQEASANANDIWSHSAIIYGQTFDGVSVRRYTIEPELLAKNISTIGVICHEFGHALGAPDFYDTDYASSGGEFCGTGVWDLLGSGAWSGDQGSRPTGVNGWQKYVWGWTDPVTLDADTVVTDMPAADHQPVAYRMETGMPGDYFYMENRQNTGVFDGSLPGHGLIVYHVNEGIVKDKLISNDINATYPQGLYTVCANAQADPDNMPSSFGAVNTDECPFPGSFGCTEFSDNTLPSAMSLDGRSSYRQISNITEENGKISFSFTHMEEPAKPQNLRAVAKNGSVVLTWDMDAAKAADVDCYNVYCNNEKIATTTDITYVDNNPPGGVELTYQVDAAYYHSMVSHPVSATIMVPSNKVEAVETSVDGSTVKLTWSTGTSLSRADIFSGSVVTADCYGETVEYANCYTPRDLSTYVGAKITRMAFFPSQGPSELTASFRIYEGDADGSNMTLVSERSVKEFASGQRRDLKLTSPVTIKAGKTYWTAVKCVGSQGVVSVACDKSREATPGLGNLIMRDGSFVQSDDAAGNFYVGATLSMPDASSGTDYEEAPTYDYDASTDLYYPTCFVVECDGSVAAYTTKREKTFTNVASGTHLYKVSSYYNGGNLSTGISKLVSVGETGILQLGATSASVRTERGCIIIEDYCGDVRICNAMGMTVYEASSDGSTTDIPLPKGLYVVALSLADGVHSVKVMVE